MIFNKTSANQHIILFGFKHVGKTLIGQQLAAVLQKKFIDLDHEFEKHYEALHAKFLNCRQIMQLHGECYYRQQEGIVLQQILQLPLAVIALGGGTLLDVNNQQKVKSHCLLHVVAPCDLVFERIMAAGGCPIFFAPDKDPYESFIGLWEARHAIYEGLTSYTIDNSASLDHALNQAKLILKTGSKVEKCA